ncbi:ABC transporter ATP-binding protein [Aeromicrobium sp. CTD01-1L150]|uniref:ABC transporter ATP-binding protein n=1 Tax=Aeromicrobium sp. CTD01-1L150 TaxID=3341830 RepID=UPI0035BFDCC6
MSNHGIGVQITGLTKRYGDVNALDGIDLTIAPGEFITLLGPSGSGKTTTLNAIAGFVEPDDGQIVLGDRPLNGVPTWKREVGVVFQHYALFPHLKVSANVAFPLKQRRVSKSESARRVTEVLDVVGLTDLADRYPRELSGGQQQRVALARALVFGPKLLLLDEPLGALDKRLREVLQLEIKRIHRETGVTFVFVTHDQEEALVMSDRIAVFNDGRIEQVAPAEELYERPRTLFAAEFLGDSNVLRGTVTRGAGRDVLTSDRGAVQLPAQHGLDEDALAALVVRPENLVVQRPHVAVATGRDSRDAVVTEVIYLGGRRRVVLEVAGEEFIADQMSGMDNVMSGEPVTVTWEIDRAAAVPVS